MSAHALLSPSSASRWMTCTPSARYETQFPDESSEYAAEGSLCHAVAEHLLNHFDGNHDPAAAQEFLDNPLYNTELFEHAVRYMQFVIEQKELADAALAEFGKGTAFFAVEKRLNISEYIPDCFGTADALIVADGTLHLIDLKYGKGVPVSCENNKQMMIYALGALAEYDMLFDIVDVKLTIYQPRIGNISSWSISVEALKEWAESVLRPAALEAHNGTGAFCAGDHCRFCRAKIRCKALAQHNLTIVNQEFAEFFVSEPETPVSDVYQIYPLKAPEGLSDLAISAIMSVADSIKNWLTAIEEYALKEALNGKKWRGYKLVEGRSVRIYGGEKDRLIKALKTAKYDDDEIFKQDLIGITAMQKLLGNAKFETLVEPYLIKPAGKPTLVPESDKRPEIGSAESAKNDFQEFINS